MRRRNLATAVLGAMLAISGLWAEEDEAVAAGRESAKAWVVLIDEGRAGESWEEAASTFRGQVKKDQWEGMMKQIRVPLGAVESREVESASFSRQLPNAPEGEYVMVVFATSFENRPGAKESVATVRDEDGRFRVVGYFIQ